MNKKTATVTWMKYNNYGTFLQAYALQNTLKSNGINNTILDDSNINIKFNDHLKIADTNIISKLNDTKNNVYVSRHSFIRKIYRFIKRVIYFRNSILEKKYKIIDEDRNKKFTEFRKNYLKISKTIDETKLLKLNEEYDAFICGSDQIWAPKDEIFNEYYYLSFVKKEKLKISYAPSIGLNSIPDNKKEKIAKLINRIDYISVREKQGADLLKNLTDKDIEVVLDPTLLLNSAKWEGIIPDKFNEAPYILCYFLGNKESHRENLKKFAKATGLRVIVLPMHFMDLALGDYSDADSGPADFLRLIRDAEYIFTDSFHGTIFSLLFNKKFITFERFDKSDKNCQNSRIHNLLSKVNLLDRIIGNESNDADVIKKEIDYDYVNNTLETERKKSLDFLFNSLEKI